MCVDICRIQSGYCVIEKIVLNVVKDLNENYLNDEILL